MKTFHKCPWQCLNTSYMVIKPMSVNEYKQKDYSTESKQGAVVCFIIDLMRNRPS